MKMMFHVSETLLTGDNKENCFSAVGSNFDFGSSTNKSRHSDVSFLRETNHINHTSDFAAAPHFSAGKSLYLSHDDASNGVILDEIIGGDSSQLTVASCVDESTCLRTPCKERVKRNELEQTSGYDSSFVSCDDVRESMEISRYLNESSCSTADDVTTEEAEMSQLEALMRTPDMKTADQFLSTLAEFSPSNFFQRSPLISVSSYPSPRVDLLHNSFSSTNDSNSCSSISSHKPAVSVSSRTAHTTSTPFSLKRHSNSIENTSNQQGQSASCSSFACHSEDTVLFTPSLNNRLRNKCLSQNVQSGKTTSASTQSRSKKSRRLRFDKTAVYTQNEEQVPNVEANFVIPTKLNGVNPLLNAADSNEQSVESLLKNKWQVGRVKVKQHLATSSNRKGTKSTTPPTLTVRPFHKHFKQGWQNST